MEKAYCSIIHIFGILIIVTNGDVEMEDTDRILAELSNLSEWARSYQTTLLLQQGHTGESGEEWNSEWAACGASWPVVRANMDRTGAVSSGYAPHGSDRSHSLNK